MKYAALLNATAEPSESADRAPDRLLAALHLVVALHRPSPSRTGTDLPAPTTPFECAECMAPLPDARSVCPTLRTIGAILDVTDDSARLTLAGADILTGVPGSGCWHLSTDGITRHGAHA